MSLRNMKPVGLLLALFVAVAAGQTPKTYHPSADETRAIERKLADLSARVKALASVQQRYTIDPHRIEIANGRTLSVEDHRAAQAQHTLGDDPVVE